LAADLDEHFGAGRFPGFLADRHFIVQMNFPGFQRLVNDVTRHQLGDAGRLHPLVAFQVGQQIAALIIHQHITLHRQLRRRRYGFGARWRPASQQQSDHQKRYQQNGSFSRIRHVAAVFRGWRIEGVILATSAVQKQTALRLKRQGGLIAVRG